MKKILVCDDDEGIAEVMEIVLQDAGYLVQILSSGKGIRKKILLFTPDLLILDIWMPGMDGEELTKILKRDSQTANLPIIIISALNDTAKIAAKAGADDFLLKPFDIEELKAKVRKYI